MRKFRPSLLSGLLVAALVVALAIPAAADLVPRQLQVDAGVEVYIDGNQLDPRDVNGNRVDALLYNGTTYVPVRAVTESLGYDVAWNGADDYAYISSVANDPLAAEYLEEYFAIAPFTGTVSRADFDAALVKVGGTATEGTGELTVADAVVAAVKAANLEELALTYTREENAKANARIAAYGLAPMAAPTAAYVAAALDASLAASTWDYDGALDAETASNLLMNVVNITGQGRNYLGMVSDPDIYAKLQSAWATFGNFDDPTLSQLGADLVLAGASTGYNLKYDGYNANFLPEYTIQYGHSDITHAVQLIALLNSEGIEAKVALEPKTSIYEYMLDWGDPTTSVATPTYELKQIKGTNRWLCYATEYDMKLEFSSIEEKNAFDSLIDTYSKKWSANQNEDGSFTPSLLAGAWWQPLYTSTVPMADTENFSLIYDNVVRNGSFTIHPFSLESDIEGIAAVVAEKAPDLSVELVKLYVNNAFYRYLNGGAE